MTSFMREVGVLSGVVQTLSEVIIKIIGFYLQKSFIFSAVISAAVFNTFFKCFFNTRH